MTVCIGFFLILLCSRFWTRYNLEREQVSECRFRNGLINIFWKLHKKYYKSIKLMFEKIVITGKKLFDSSILTPSRRLGLREYNILNFNKVQKSSSNFFAISGYIRTWKISFKMWKQWNVRLSSNLYIHLIETFRWDSKNLGDCRFKKTC